MRIYKIKVNGKTYEVKIVGISESEPVEVKSVKVEAAPKATPAAAPAAAPVSSNGKSIDSPMQGNILDVKVKVGDNVKEGDTVCILEAMKLENEIKAPFAGKVLEVKVKKGDQVNSKAPLVILG